MLAFAIRRLFQAIGVMLVVALISFVMFRFVGDPVSQLVGVDTPPEQRALLRKELGLDDPIYVQFGRFVDKAAHFDFGISYQIKQPVAKLIAQRLPAAAERISLAAASLRMVASCSTSKPLNCACSPTRRNRTVLDRADGSH